MKASDLMILYKYISLCQNPFDYISMLQLFLLDIGKVEAKEYGIKRIFYETIKILSEEFNITELTRYEKHDCKNNGVIEKLFNLVNVINNFELNEYRIDDNPFVIKLSEPKFDLDTITNDTKVFIDGIKCLEFENGESLTLNDLSNEELETFMKMVDLDTYNKLNELMDCELYYIKSLKCDTCGFEEVEPSTDYLEVLITLMDTILEIE